MPILPLFVGYKKGAKSLSYHNEHHYCPSGQYVFWAFGSRNVHDWTALPTRICYCSNPNWHRSFQCRDNKVDLVVGRSSWTITLLTLYLYNNQYVCMYSSQRTNLAAGGTLARSKASKTRHVKNHHTGCIFPINFPVSLFRLCPACLSYFGY